MLTENSPRQHRKSSGCGLVVNAKEHAELTFQSGRNVRIPKPIEDEYGRGLGVIAKVMRYAEERMT
jgi:hypothetical protein